MSLTGDFDQLRKAIAALQQVADGRVQEAVVKTLSEEFVELVHEGFSESRDPYGMPWQMPVHRSGQPLRDTGRLMSSWHADDSGLRIRVYNNTHYGVYHQEGTRHLPIRRMLPLDGELPPKWAEAAEEATRDALEELGLI